MERRNEGQGDATLRRIDSAALGGKFVKRQRVALLNPPWGRDFVRSARWAAKSRGRVQRHPEQALTLVAYLEEKGHECFFLDAAAMNMAEHEVLRRIEDFRPMWTIVHTTTPSIYNDVAYAETIKRLTGCKTVLIGAHVSAEPESTFRISGGGVDYIVRGEPELPMGDLLAGVSPDSIGGLSYLRDGVVVNNPIDRYIDVNELPFPAWRHVDPRWYHDAGKLYPFITLYSARGCPGQCTFCRERHVIHGPRLRLRDPVRVVDEMEYDLRLFPFLREIMFETDTFTAVTDHAAAICDEIMRRGLHRRVRWSCNARVDADLALLPLMKKAGCRMLMVGFEFGTDAQLASVKKHVTIEMSRKFAETAAQLGFTLHGCFMIGAPGETPESAQATIDLALSLPLDTIQISGIAVYPGTPLYEWARHNGFLTAKDWREWVSPEREQVTILSYPQMSKDEMDRFIDIGLRRFYLRPRQILKMLFSIRNMGDVFRKLYGLRSFLDYFFFKKISRRTTNSRESGRHDCCS